MTTIILSTTTPNSNTIEDQLQQHAIAQAKYKEALGNAYSNRAGARRYVPHAFHKHVLQNAFIHHAPDDKTTFPNIFNPLFWDPSSTNQGNLDIRVWNMAQNFLPKSKGSSRHSKSRRGKNSRRHRKDRRPYTLSRISVRHIKEGTYKTLLEKCNKIGLYHFEKKIPSNRTNDIGVMVGTGQHVARFGKTVTNFVKPADFHNELNGQLCQEIASYMEKVYPHHLITTRHAERAHGVHPQQNMGGENGVASSMDQSIDLANATHFDINDASTSFSLWSELNPNTAKNWFFVLPNLRVFCDGKMYNGVIIKLNHGTSICWDGRIIRHGTSITDINGNDFKEVKNSTTENHVFGTFFAAKAKTLETALKNETA